MEKSLPLFQASKATGTMFSFPMPSIQSSDTTTSELKRLLWMSFMKPDVSCACSSCRWPSPGYDMVSISLTIPEKSSRVMYSSILASVLSASSTHVKGSRATPTSMGIPLRSLSHTMVSVTLP